MTDSTQYWKRYLCSV